MELYVRLVDKMRSGLDVSELILSFNETYKNLNEYKAACDYYITFLCAATYTAHIELVRYILTDPRFIVRRTSLKTILRCLFTATSSGNIALVQIFLDLRLSLKLLSRDLEWSDKSRNGFPRHKDMPSDLEFKGSHLRWIALDVFSAVEHACLCDQREILKLLVAYHLDQERCSIGTERNYQPSTPLQVVVKFLRYDSFRQMLTLPAIIQLILDTGVDVNTIVSNGYNALFLLIDEVNHLCIKKVDMTAEECEMIVATARLLLAAGSINTDEYLCLPEKLLRQTLIERRGCVVKSVVVEKNFCKMICDLVKLLLSHGALDTRYSKKKVLYGVIFETLDCIRVHDSLTDPTLTQAIDPTARIQTNLIIIDCISNIFHYLLLADADAMNHFLFSDADEDEGGSNIFQFAFAYFAQYSSKSGHATNLIRLMLIGLHAAQVNRLKIKLLLKSSVRVLPSMYGASVDYDRKALELISAVEVPYSLLHLSRRAITRAMSYRCLDEQAMSTLGLSKRITEYVLLDCD